MKLSRREPFPSTDVKSLYIIGVWGRGTVSHTKCFSCSIMVDEANTKRSFIHNQWLFCRTHIKKKNPISQTFEFLLFVKRR